MTVLFIVVNAAVFLYGALLGKQSEEMFVATFSLVPARLFSPDAAPGGTAFAWATIFTSMFLHGGPLHIAGNMLYLWIFGNNIEDAMGSMRFVIFYLLSGVAAAFSHALLNTESVIPLIGASGAVSGVLGAYVLLYPRARVLTLMVFGFFARMVEIPAMFILGFWFVFQFLSALVSPGVGGGVAWYAHIGGFIAGMVLIGFFKRNDVPFGGRRGYRQL
ncbi:MAG TPA: rhomboid family intramembrane serine protease [Nitrospirota bacterium]|nr:rhomboid family intramembrane serine protease [Nitrospirota bacterium]